MSTLRWLGTSANVKQVSKITVANTWTAADTYTLTIDSVDFVITIGTLVTTAQVATTIYQALTGTTFTDTTAACTIPVADGGANHIPQFADFVATNNTASQVLLTGGTVTSPVGCEGKPFTISATGDGTASTGTGAITSITSPTSQFHADQVDNWSGNAAPADGDTLIFDNGSIDIRWGLDTYASGATTAQPTTLKKFKAFTGNVGLSETNTDNSSKPYHEYRTTYFTTDDNSTTCTASLEIGDGQGSGRFKWNYGAGRTDVTIYGKGTRADTGVPCILLKGTHASNTISNLRGDVGVAFFGGETATIATITSGDGPNSQANTYCGSGCTLTTVKVNGGTMTTNSAVTTATMYAGAWEHYSGTVTTLAVNGGTFFPMAALTITNCTVYGKIDLSKTSGAITFTNLVQVFGEIYDPNGKATFSAGYKLNVTTAKVIRPAGDTHSLS